MIQSITIENFKGICEPVTLELKPVTLLFGANSSGKSTVIQALHYLCEIFLRHNLDADETLNGGRFVELGGFRNFVHLRDTNKEMRFKIVPDCPNERLPTDPRDHRSFESLDDGELNERLCAEVTLELSIRWSHLLNKPLVSRYAASAQGALLGEVLASLDGKQVRVEKLNLSHPLVVNRDLSQVRELVESKLWQGVIPLFGLSDALPLDVGVMMAHLDGFGEDCPYSQDTEILLNRLLMMFLVWPGQAVRSELRDFRYIGPIREIPARNHVPFRSPDPWRWANGLAAWDMLAEAKNTFIDRVNIWLSGEGRLNSGYSLNRRQVIELDVQHPLVRTLQSDGDLESVRDFDLWKLGKEIHRLPLRTLLRLYDEQKRLEVAPQDLGVGISQMLPVVVGCLDPAMRILAVEQPELHIHPALQARLGDLFIAETQMRMTQKPPTHGWRKRVILETHSEHLILRLLRRIRETTEGTLPPGDGEMLSFKPADLNVYYVEPGTAEAGMKLTALRVDDHGDFVDRWPNGFFEERIQEFL